MQDDLRRSTSPPSGWNSLARCPTFPDSVSSRSRRETYASNPRMPQAVVNRGPQLHISNEQPRDEVLGAGGGIFEVPRHEYGTGEVLPEASGICSKNGLHLGAGAHQSTERKAACRQRRGLHSRRWAAQSN